MINGTHTIIYAEDAEQARAFFRDVLGYPNIDAHEGWLIFKMPPVEDQGWGLVTRFRVPGAGEMGLYQPRHQTAYDL